MTSQEDLAFMKAYALLGISDWRQVARRTQVRAQRLLGNRLAEHEWDAATTIDSILNGRKGPKFIPMPNQAPAGIAHSFFMPTRIDADRTAFDLLVLCKDSADCLGFRFEPADHGVTNHAYGHIQMNRRMDGSALAVSGLPQWVPTSYPAFPLRTSTPVEIFLSMVTSIHGYRKDMAALLQRVIPAAGSRQVYEKMLEAAMI